MTVSHLKTLFRSSPRRQVSAIAICLAVTAFLPAQSRGDIVYFNNFETADISGWSTSTPAGAWASSIHTETTPIGNRGFLGQFGKQDATLSLTNLAAHTQVSVSLDLFILRTWDGSFSDPAAGPDQWRASIVGGPTLLNATFSNFTDPLNPSYGSYSTQSYPSGYPGSTNVGQTGAVEKDSLGYLVPDFTPQPGRFIDSVYHLSLNFDSSASDLSLRFEGLLIDAGATLANESWGMDNVTVSISSVPEPSSLALLLVLSSGIATRLARRRSKLSAN